MVRDHLTEVWEWFDYRRGVLANCGPNEAHYALARWQNIFPDFALITQNIDGLHALAGSRDVVELHGNIDRAACTKCGKRFDLRGSVPHSPEKCDECRAELRPDVVLFGEMLPAGVFERAQQNVGRCELFFVVGTSALVYPAAGLAQIAKSAGAFLVEINPEETPLTGFCDSAVRGKAGEVLPCF
jgi:NAD-dependent deacetylase